MRAQNDELLLTGRAVPGEPELVDLVAALRRTADAPAPGPTPALSQLLREGLPTQAAVSTSAVSTSVGSAGTASTRARRRLRTLWRYVAGLGLAGKIALGAGVAFAGVTGAATIGAVPDVIQAPARAVVERVAHLFEQGTNAPVAPVPTSSPTRASGREAPRVTPGGAPSVHGPATRPTHPTPVPPAGVEGRSPEEVRPTSEASMPPASDRRAEPDVPEVAGTPAAPGAVAPTLPPTARADVTSAHPWESDAEHANAHD
ncbi:hypothetical protein [Cellulomonas sp. P24]|uniref:hypothetical protein n=1 Tax=Cellulomonas sp. P24 TaxID=2885206 RepID=UPI00216AF818|nr:hypothetical protein [Cellulomonas sp. P24]MCR6493213.1 hypothetical protein [Cellulomonas sp. P24]